MVPSPNLTDKRLVLGPAAGEIRGLQSSSFSGSSMGSSTGSGSSAGGVVSRGSCQVRVYANGCEEKRSCRDCLNAAADDGLDCYLDATTGTCSAVGEVSATALQATAAQTTNATERLQLLASDYKIYASTSQRYCSVNDNACTLCEAIADLRGYAPSSNQLKRMSTDRSICYGSNNCICATKCEATAWLTKAGKRCASSASSVLPTTAASDHTKSKMLLFIGLFAAIQIFVLVVLVVRRKRQIDRRREANGPYNTAGVVTDANRLQLPGWMAWQRELRNQEKHEAPYVNLHKLRPSSSRHTLVATASEASIATQPLSSPPSTRHGDERFSM